MLEEAVEQRSSFTFDRRSCFLPGSEVFHWFAALFGSSVSTLVLLARGFEYHLNRAKPQEQLVCGGGGSRRAKVTGVLSDF